LKFDQPNRSFLLRATDFQETHHTVGIASFIAEILKQRIYLFNAERLNISQHRISPGLEVQPNAANLAQVLHYLHTSNPSQFDRLTQLLGTILPEIKSITIPPIDGSSARILVWSIGPDSERADLAIPLSESGTGIGQVLAILFVAVTSAFSRTIIIDEPQSFLHPGAIRKLFDILKHKFSQHQYIITTHSPVAITAVEPQMILLVRKEDEESRIESIDVMETQGARLALSEIGARLSDVFGAENILWVEGRTEELCFPLILSRIAKQGLLGTAIIGIVQIGDFEGKLSKTIFEIYVRLSKGRGLLPPAIGFIFDQEGRSERERDDLVRQSGGKIVFLPRRMYENYVLNPIAIAAIMSSLEGFRGTRVESDEIKD
jgi:hypothetical protein